MTLKECTVYIEKCGFKQKKEGVAVIGYPLCASYWFVRLRGFPKRNRAGSRRDEGTFSATCGERCAMFFTIPPIKSAVSNAPNDVMAISPTTFVSGTAATIS